MRIKIGQFRDGFLRTSIFLFPKFDNAQVAGIGYKTSWGELWYERVSHMTDMELLSWQLRIAGGEALREDVIGVCGSLPKSYTDSTAKAFDRHEGAELIDLFWIVPDLFPGKLVFLPYRRRTLPFQ